MLLEKINLVLVCMNSLSRDEAKSGQSDFGIFVKIALKIPCMEKWIRVIDLGKTYSGLFGSSFVMQ